ncbi:MAG TPA: MazG family protein [Nocardioidaceae bacterium]|nr:MazG family protein [Nocardioidaceae bacterium]
MGRLVLLQTSPRVAAGLLTAQAWDVVRTADSVLCSEPGTEVERAVAAAGVEVETTTDPLPALLAACDGGRTAVWLAADDDDLADTLATEVVARAERGDETLEVEVLAGSYDLPGSRLLDLVEVMDRLREHCPWDREQTHRSLVRYLVEESYETLEAIEAGDRDHLREELGDLLLQVMFHSRIAAEHPDDPWTVDDVAADIVEKLVRRHPHVFAGLDVDGVDDVETNWESIKSAEKQRSSVLEGIPTAMPALSLAEKVLGRAKRVGLEATDVAASSAAGEPGAPGRDLGTQLLSLVAQARVEGVDPEQALRDAVRRASETIQAAEAADKR